MNTLMAIPAGLDPDVLRSFVLIAEKRSFTEAGVVVGRTQSAISIQIKRLEEILDHRLFRRTRGGQVELTPHGHYLLPRAREILAMNDAVFAAFRAPAITGTVRLGSPDDYAFAYIPTILKRFAETHPAVQVDVVCMPSNELFRAFQDERLDLALVSEGQDFGAPATRLWRGPLHWITATRYAPHRQEPLPLALSNRESYGAGDCEWAKAAVEALKAAGRPYRIAYTSASQIGTHAPVMAGLAVTVSTLSWLPEGLRAVRPEEGLPPLPDFGIQMLRARHLRAPAQALADHIQDSFRLHVDMNRAALPAAAE